jgi:hypothetical protein
MDPSANASGVRALIVPSMLDTGSAASQAIKPLGWVRGLDRGHLLANRLGGSGKIEANLVAMYEGPNRGAMRSFENRAYNFVASCHALYYTATPNYGGGTLPVRSIFLTAWGVGYYDMETIVNEP